jgi:hypothetical protein
MNLDESTKEYDAAFNLVPGLTWLPWVGQHYSERSPHKRLLVVGESHYYNGETPEERQANREKWLVHPQYTREVVSESLVNYEWTTRTLDTIPRLLFKTNDIDRPRLWGASAYYNIVQRMMDYKRDGSPERPTWDDYVHGWKTFAEVVSIIQPSQCLFIGVTAANSFNHWIASQSVFTGCINVTQNIGGTWARLGKLEIGGKSTELIFVKHLGLPLSWAKWHDYLQTHHAEFMNWLATESYANTCNNANHPVS